MSLVEWTEWKSSVARILAIADQEALFIQRGELEEIWRLRQQRRDLTNLVAEQWGGTVDTNGLLSDQVDDLSLLLRSICDADRRNMERLAGLKRDAATQLVHLYEGKQAVDAYRVDSGRTPEYIDRRG